MSDGSIVDPFHSLKQALENPRLKPGQTIYLRDGTHPITEDTTLSASGITIQPYPGEEASICFYSRDGWKRLWITGDDNRFRHLRIWSDPPHRRIQFTQDRANNHLGVIDVQGKAPDDGLFADCRLHDLYDVQWFAAAKGGTLYQDCDLLNFGLIDANIGRSDGEFMYTQNQPDAPVKSVRNSIFGPCYSVAFQLYTYGGAVQHYRLDDLIFIQSGRIYHHNGEPGSTADVLYARLFNLASEFVEWPGVTHEDIPQAADAPTVVVNACTTPNAKRIAHVGVSSPTRLDTVSVDVSALGLTRGARYTLRSALNPLVEVTTFVYAGGSLNVPMIGRAMAIPIGEVNGPLVTVDKRFGAFILEAA